jgi:hypothetical protein
MWAYATASSATPYVMPTTWTAVVDAANTATTNTYAIHVPPGGGVVDGRAFVPGIATGLMPREAARDNEDVVAWLRRRVDEMCWAA